MIEGIDVSHYQDSPTAPGGIDWPAVRRAGIRFAYLKASEGCRPAPGAFLDPSFAANARGAGGAGLTWGAYHFARPRWDLSRQVDFFAPLALKGTLPPALDLEDSGGLPDGALEDWALGFLKRLEACTRRRPLLYTNAAYGKRLPGLGAYPLWIANPGRGGASHPGPAPALPPAWDRWLFWQYSWKGRVPGITGPVDLDRFAGSLEDLYALSAAGLGLPEPPAEALEARVSRLERAVFGIEPAGPASNPGGGR